MKSKAFKVIGTQSIPKVDGVHSPWINQIVANELKESPKDSYRLFERLVRPVRKEFVDNLMYEDSKQNSKRTFMVIGVMDMIPKGNVTGRIRFNPSRFLGMNILDEINSLVKTVN